MAHQIEGVLNERNERNVIEFCIDTDTETSNEINKIALTLKEGTEIQRFKKSEATIVNRRDYSQQKRL